MNEPVGKASGRTLNRIGTCLADPCWSSLFDEILHSLKNVNFTAVRSLGKRITHVRLCNDDVNRRGFVTESMMVRPRGNGIRV